jgi:hypothetical protein
LFWLVLATLGGAFLGACLTSPFYSGSVEEYHIRFAHNVLGGALFTAVIYLALSAFRESKES